MQSMLDEKEWRNLLEDIDAGTVVPVIGSSLITLSTADGKIQPLYAALAPLLAAELGLPNPETFTTTSQVASTHILSGRERSKVYRELRSLLKSTESSGCAVSAALRQLARIRSFPLYVGTTPDHQMQNALREYRSAFDPSHHVKTFHPNEPPEKIDLPANHLQDHEVFLYQLLGDYDVRSGRDFAVWEEDLMEFVCGLLERTGSTEKSVFLVAEVQLIVFGRTSGRLDGQVFVARCPWRATQQSQRG